MKLYDGGRAPNPRRVRIYLAEKGMNVPLEQVDLGALAQKSPAFTAVNPVQRVPALELDDGTVIAESIAICRYFEALHPEPPLFGKGAKDEAMVEMWQRRVEFHLLAPISHIFRNSHPAMKEMEVPQVPAWAEANKPRVMDFLALLDRRAEGSRVHRWRQLHASPTSPALVSVDFMKPAKLAVAGGAGKPQALARRRIGSAERESLTSCG